MTVREYSTPLAFKQALEQRLRSAAATGTDFGRRRQLLVFDRFLARLGKVAGDAVTLKGGLVLELRLERARTAPAVKGHPGWGGPFRDRRAFDLDQRSRCAEHA